MAKKMSDPQNEPPPVDPTRVAPMEVYGADRPYDHAVSIWIPNLGINVSVHNVEPAPFTGEPEVAIFVEGDLSKVRIIDDRGDTWPVGPQQ
jgi:hypothetical protein